MSQNDSSVLSALFDPEALLSRNAPIEDNMHIDIQVSMLQSREHAALQLINQEQPDPSDIRQAISMLTDIIHTNSSYSSAFSNRAQANRLLVSDDQLPQHPALVADIIADLSTAIQLSSPQDKTSPISRSAARVLASAHTHRGFLLLLASKSEDKRRMFEQAPPFKNLARSQLEEVASKELTLGGHYGNEIARQLAVKTNPYAKLCGAIVKEALTKEISEFHQLPATVV
jgi:hypothetical protein